MSFWRRKLKLKLPDYPSAFETIFYPIYNKMIGREFYDFAKNRIDSEKLPADQLQKLQLEKLRKVLQNAENHVPFYREKFAEIGFKAAGLRDLEEFGQLDFFVTKNDVRENPELFVASNCNRKKLNWHRTGGSTGEPLYFATDSLTDAASAAAMSRALRWWGARFGDRHAIFWGSPTYVVKSKRDWPKRAAVAVRDTLMNRLYISNYNLTTENIRSSRKKLERFRPKYIRGMPSSLYLFAKTILKGEGALQEGRPRFVHSACEQLFDWQKEVIEEGFGAPVLNTYGLSEFGDIAFEAPCRQLHTMDEDVFVEAIPFGGDGKELVVTQLNNLSSPLIRYRTADVADNLSYCGCELGLRTIEGLKGRAHDFIVAPDGRYLHGQFFTHLIVFETGIVNYQIWQKAPDMLEISLVVDHSFDHETEGRVRQATRNHMGGEVDVRFKYVDSIPLTTAGKHRWIISDLVLPNDLAAPKQFSTD